MLHQQCSGMQLDVGRHIVHSSCVGCCVEVLEFAYTSACVCVSCFCTSDAHDFFAECFIGCRRSMRRRRVTATREWQHDMSRRKFFVLDGLVPAMLIATWWVRPSSMTGGEGNLTTVVKKKALALVTFSDALILRAYFLSIIKHVSGYEWHDISFECCLQLCSFQQHLMMRNFIECFECGAN